MKKNVRKKTANEKKSGKKEITGQTLLKKGDKVMVISGGNKKKRPIKGQVGKIVSFVE